MLRMREPKRKKKSIWTIQEWKATEQWTRTSGTKQAATKWDVMAQLHISFTFRQNHWRHHIYFSSSNIDGLVNSAHQLLIDSHVRAVRAIGSGREQTDSLCGQCMEVNKRRWIGCDFLLSVRALSFSLPSFFFLRSFSIRSRLFPLKCKILEIQRNERNQMTRFFFFWFG